MHKVYENEDLMMYFKKRYCHCCGNILKKKKSERVVKKTDPEHKEYCSIGGRYTPHGDILVIGKEYICSSCKKIFSCDEQFQIIAAQEYFKKKIVSKHEIKSVHENKMLLSIINIMKLRWILLLPGLGGLVCLYNIFSSNLKEKTNKYDQTKVLILSLLSFFITCTILKFILPIFNDDFINNYYLIIMLILSSFSFNIPVLCYINTKFKTIK